MENDKIACNSLPSVLFPSFPHLPPHVRIRIWRHAAFVPRVVEVHEAHTSVYTLRPKAVKPETAVLSNTRPPAILSVNREARSLALSIYAPMYLELNHPHDDPFRKRIPIYANPHVDITYRGKDSCERGDAFRIRWRNYDVDAVPLTFTHTLAVDIEALRPLRRKQAPVLAFEEFIGQICLRKCHWEGIEQYTMTEAAREVIACSRQGMRELILVVGNHEDLSDIKLIPVEPESRRWSDIFYQAERQASFLRDVLATNSSSPPTVKVMTPKRVPLKSFPQFSKLPYEIRNLIWSYACNIPRVIRMEQTSRIGPENAKVTNFRPPALFHVCRASRSILQAKCKTIELPGDRPYKYYNPMLDTVLLPSNVNQREFSKYSFRVIAIENSWNLVGKVITSAAKGLSTEEIVILTEKVPSQKRRCEMTLTHIGLEERSLDDDDSPGEICAKASETRLEKEIRLKLGKRYRVHLVGRQSAANCNSPTPKVSIGRLVVSTETVSPYS